MLQRNKRLRVMAGPNGSGKTTVIQYIQQNYYCGPFINPDILQQQLLVNKAIYLDAFAVKSSPSAFQRFSSGIGQSWHQKAASMGAAIGLSVVKNKIIASSNQPGPYDAAMAADFIRHLLLKSGTTFTFETVLSHPSKVDFLSRAQEAGFRNYLYFVCTVDPEINKQRVEQRVIQGGHYVDPQTIEKRYYSSLEVLSQLIPFTHRAYFFDNSARDARARLIAEVEKSNKLIIHDDHVPWWLEAYLIHPLFSKE